jgi:hypothetical protein
MLNNKPASGLLFCYKKLSVRGVVESYFIGNF